ncbi:MAG TPA: ATP-binding protein [Verrucomicrobiales bacterium]|nr:ATP-binding protein [Verrucomicrobiales bacterium]
MSLSFQQLQVINHHWKRTVDQLEEGVLILQGDPGQPETLGILYANPAFSKRAGADGDELRGRAFAGVLGGAPSSPFRERWKQILAGPAVFHSGDGAAALPEALQGVRWKVSPLFAEGEARESTFAVSLLWPSRIEETGLSAGASLETDFVLERANTLSHITGGYVHDVNNALTVIRGELETALQENDAAALKEAVRQVLKVTDSTTRLCRGLLNYSKGLPQGRSRCEISGLIAESVHIAGLGSNVRIVSDIAEELPAIAGDRVELIQVLNNLLLNARQAMPEGGVIHLSARSRRFDPGPDGLTAGEYLILDVRDRGCGIDPEHLPRIFDPLFSTKPEGSGLGLATCRRIVQQHGGAMRVESAPGRGSTFSLLLPALPAGLETQAGSLSGEESQAPDPEGLSLHGDGTRILFVDDQAQITAFAQRFLEKYGYRVTAASSGQEAIDRFRAAWATGTGFDLVILDMTLPGGLSGWDTFEELRAIEPDVVCIAASGSFDENSEAGLAAHGFAGMLAKPFPLQDLARVVERCLSRQPV